MKKVTILTLLILLMGLMPAAAADSPGWSPVRIVQSETKVTVSGNAPDAYLQVTIQVLDSRENVIYVDQAASSETGEYVFDFPVTASMRGQTYRIRIGGAKAADPIEESVTIKSPVEPTPSATPDPSPQPTPSATPDPSPQPTPSATPDPSPQPTPSATPDPSPQPTPSATPDPSPRPTPSATPDPSPRPTPSATPDPAASPKPGMASPGDDTKLPSGPDDIIVDAKRLETAEAGIVAVELEQGKGRLVFSAAYSDFKKIDSVIVRFEGSELSIPAATIRSMLDSLGKQEGAAPWLVLDIARISTTEAARSLQAAAHSSEAIQVASDAYRIEFAGMKPDGSRTVQEAFAPPIRMSLKLSPNKQASLSGIYEWREGGGFHYLRSRWDEKRMAADVTRSGNYMLLEYDKTFTDVPSDHWAAEAVRLLSARHIVDGVTADTFEPGREVTRAEFTKLLVRTLDLKAAGSSGFPDVAADEWYAASIAAAREAGIVTGDEAGLFHPQASITREEMAVMLLRTYTVMTGEQPGMEVPAVFNDSGTISEWAQAYVHTAARLGLLSGYEDNTFKPKGAVIRSESAQAVYNLLSLDNRR
ncbi:S-layer homology domain-containing protein [Paenibacillus residui]|uniref:S-layer homology domain-containing protein n=1 Tax=Paenibacillus residui TaxID=629724 RepID=A0ABW3DIU7_9BACL